MKSGFTCPVCKVPYRRREVHPAPHMDNLVTIYKSMEVASGFNIFVTQNAPSTKVSDGGNNAEGVCTSGRQEAVGNCRDRAEHQAKHKLKEGKKPLKTNLRSSSLNRVKPSCPTNKRVQVPQCPALETSPTRREKLESGLGEITENRQKNGLVVPNEKPALIEKGKEALELSPFFWLREDDALEKSSQQMELDLPTDMELLNGPSFSDIKDSDDEYLSEKSPEGKVCRKFNTADFFDSEIFEWTQRACSPELCPSPMKLQEWQIPDTEELEEIQEKEFDVFSEGTNPNKQILEAENPKIVNPRGQNGIKKKTDKRHRNAKPNKREQKKCGKESIDQVLPSHPDTSMKAEKVLDHLHNDIGNSSSYSEKKATNSKKGKKRKPDSAEHNGLDEAMIDHNERNEDMLFQLVPLYVPLAESSKISNLREKTGRQFRGNKAATKPKFHLELQSAKRVKSLTNDITKDRNVNNGHQKELQPIGKAKENPNAAEALTNSKKRKVFHAMEGVVLHKCKTSVNKHQCAFCHSSEVSEASGEMMHYFNERPVPDDYDGGSNIIHSHRNCTEWAPNVYFQDDTAKNLKAELARSLKIKCSLCGIKGAALGCYEKSCRKSFHVPCAKMVPQCRWDMDNFVMLCPLHTSSKLPNQIDESHRTRTKKCILKGKSKCKSGQITVANGVGKNHKWNSRGSHEKLNLCCSALTKEDKETVAEFEKSSGVIALKKWDSSVTHVIASTDENGACRRTLKILMGILEGKWIISVDWIKASMKSMELVNEEPYEISIDVYGCKDGPKLGRLRLLNKQPKIFGGVKFYFCGDFVPSYKGYLQDLVTAAGGTVLHRKPISRDQELLMSESTAALPTFIIYSLELPNNCDPTKKNLILTRRRSDAEALATSTGAKVATNLWVLNSIASSKLQILEE